MNTDYHIHSIASGHAYNTILEIANHAHEKKLEAIALTDHGPSMDGASTIGYFECLARIPKQIENVKIFQSCEANVIDTDGTIDIDKRTQKALNFVMVGLHERTPFPTNLSSEDNTRALLNAVKNNRINVIAHPFRPNFPVDLLELIPVCVKNNVALEINLSSLKSYKNDADFMTKMREMIELVKKYNGKMTLSSDAHFVSEIGDASVLPEAQLDIPKEILFDSVSEFREFIARK